MRILHLSQSYVPSRRASSVQVMKMCGALARRGHRVTLVTKRSRSKMEPNVDDDHAFYGVAASFRLRKLSRPDVRGGGLAFAWGLRRLIQRSSPDTLLYCRDPVAAWLGSRSGRKVVFEAHQPPTGFVAKWLFRRLLTTGRLRRLVVISAALRAELGRLALLPADLEVIVAADAADARDEAPKRVAAKTHLHRGLRIGYLGSLHPGKGAELVVRLAAQLPEHEFELTGGEQGDLERLRAAPLPRNLRLRGFASPARAPAILDRADILLMPYRRSVLGAGRSSNLAPWMSPLKMFEYMAAGKAIIASDLPVLREVLKHEHNALLVPPEDLEAWLAAVRRLREDESLRSRLADAARSEQAALYTWDARAEAVLADLSPGPADLCILRPTMGQGGADRVTATLLRSLDRHRFRPRLALMRAEGALLDQVPSDVPIHDLGGHSLWTAWWPLARLLRRTTPRILLSTSSGANLIAVLGRRICGRPVRLVLSERNMLYRDQGRFKRWLQIRLKRWLYPRAECVTAVSEGVRQDLLTRLQLPPDRVKTVYNPAVSTDIESLAAVAVSHPWFAERIPVVLAAGRLVRAKGFDVMLEAFARLRTRRPARLVLLGDGPQRNALAALADALGVSDSVWLAGFDANPFRYMARCSVFVLSSRHEGLPGALIQAMACGAAVVATDCASGPAEIVDDGVTGLLVPVDDPSAISATIERLLDEPGLAVRLGQAARQAAGRFSTDTAIEAYVGALIGDSASEATTP